MQERDTQPIENVGAATGDSLHDEAQSPEAAPEPGTPRRRLRDLGIVLIALQIAVLLWLAVYLLVSDKALVIGFQRRPLEDGTPGGASELIVPVAGVRSDQLRDSWGAARSGGRSHKGVDIMAPHRTPVLAAAAGVIVKRDSNAVAGRALYQRGMDGRTIYYYAHLDSYRQGLKEGDLVRQGDVIAYVGDTGNAAPGNYHLHFAVYTVTDPNRWWRGRDLNPYPLLRDGAKGPDSPER